MRNKQLPQLLTSHGQAGEKQSFYSLLENRYQTTCLPILCGKRILGSAYGWLVLADPSTDDCCLWNPKSSEKILLPRLHRSSLYNRCVLSKPPTEPDCIVVFNYSCLLAQSVCRIGDDKFVKRKSFDQKDLRLLMAMSSMQGEIYGIINAFCRYEFVTIHLVGETVEFRPLLIDGKHPWQDPQPKRSWVTMNSNYLIESPCGVNELLLVTKMFSRCYLIDRVEFRVFRVNVDGLECVELQNIDGLTIFIGYYGNGFCCSSSSGRSKPNSIYYTNGNGRAMYVYDLDDRSTTALLPCPVLGATCRLTIGSTSRTFSVLKI